MNPILNNIDYLPQGLSINKHVPDDTIVDENGNNVIILYREHITFVLNNSNIGYIMDCIRRFKICDFDYSILASESVHDIGFLRPNLLIIDKDITFYDPIICHKMINPNNYSISGKSLIRNLNSELELAIMFKTLAQMMNHGYTKVAYFINCEEEIPQEMLVNLSLQFKDIIFTITGGFTVLNGAIVGRHYMLGFILHKCKELYSANELLSDRQPIKSANTAI